MAAVHRRGYPLRHSVFWDETECLNYYGMLSLHEVFEIVGSQLTETDIEVLSFLLNETFAAPHPLDPAGWTVEPREGDPGDPGVSPCSELLRTWRQLKPPSSQESLVDSCKPTSGLELLLELERRGYISDGQLEPLLQLLRVLTRHDLLPFVSRKKRRTGEGGSQTSGYLSCSSSAADAVFRSFAVSPERIECCYGTRNMELVCNSGMQHGCRHTETPFSSFTHNLRTSKFSCSTFLTKCHLAPSLSFLLGMWCGARSRARGSDQALIVG